MTQSIEHKFEQLVAEWNEWLQDGADGHKDRDCHFYINKVWSYGKAPVYRFEHYAYLGYYIDFPKPRATYVEALQDGIDWLEETLQDYKYDKDEI